MSWGGIGMVGRTFCCELEGIYFLYMSRKRFRLIRADNFYYFKYYHIFSNKNTIKSNKFKNKATFYYKKLYSNFSNNKSLLYNNIYVYMNNYLLPLFTDYIVISDNSIKFNRFVFRNLFYCNNSNCIIFKKFPAIRFQIYEDLSIICYFEHDFLDKFGNLMEKGIYHKKSANFCVVKHKKNHRFRLNKKANDSIIETTHQKNTFKYLYEFSFNNNIQVKFYDTYKLLGSTELKLSMFVQTNNIYSIFDLLFIKE